MCPGRSREFVPRRRLVEALREGLARGRVLVCRGIRQTALLADSVPAVTGGRWRGWACMP